MRTAQGGSPVDNLSTLPLRSAPSASSPVKRSAACDGFVEGGNMAEESIIRIPPYHYIHVLDQNTNVARIELGPKTYIRQDNERVLFSPERMITVPPRHYCIIETRLCEVKTWSRCLTNLAR
ncbi:major vault protein-like [Heterodontus francisci]|uniref:major vault protein-like n=1 Tax=Heterodontus francisci TaxID=7792 RepID=UPI00355B5337